MSLRIGLTGGIASGKSTAARRFMELGVPVIDADDSARTVVARGSPGLDALTTRFGREILDASGALDRPRLRSLVFAQPELRKALETILHPLIRADMKQRALNASGPYVVMAIPLLVEGGSRRDFDRILVIDVPEDVQLARLMMRDGGSPDQARAILAAQATRAARLKAADDILVNSDSVDALRQKVDQMHAGYLTLATNPGVPESI